MTPQLQKSVEDLHNISNDKLRYQQLLFLATKCKPMPVELKIPENKVSGCLSTVHIHATRNVDGTISYIGDSDAQLTKGLVALLIDGLSNNQIDDILQIQPEFISYAGITTSLTPGRNSGFLNMLQLMKKKAFELKVSTNNEISTKEINFKQTVESTPHPTPIENITILNDKPIYNSMIKKLSMLKPSVLEVEDVSYQHAGHKESSAKGEETHFNVNIVSTSFEGLTLIQRHKMIYTLLTNEMSTQGGIHALSIKANTPAELN